MLATPESQKMSSKFYIHGVSCPDSTNAPARQIIDGLDQPFIEVSSKIADEIQSICHERRPDLAEIIISGLSVDTTDFSVLRERIPFDMEQALAIRCEFDSLAPSEEWTPSSLAADPATTRLWWTILHQFNGHIPEWLAELNTPPSTQGNTRTDKKSHILELSQVHEVQRTFDETLAGIELSDEHPISYFWHHIVHTALESTHELLQTHSPALQRLTQPLRAMFINAAMVNQIMQTPDQSPSGRIASKSLQDLLQSNIFQMLQSCGIWLRDDSWPHSVALRFMLRNSLKNSNP